jgi:hypothetical protein
LTLRSMFPPTNPLSTLQKADRLRNARRHSPRLSQHRFLL